MNKHNYTYGDMITNLPAMNRIMHIRGDPDAPHVPKGHKKQYNIWDKGNAKPDIPPDMRAFPTNEELHDAWEDGLLHARRLCHSLGMAPQMYDPGGGDQHDEEEVCFSCHM